MLFGAAFAEVSIMTPVVAPTTPTMTSNTTMVTSSVAENEKGHVVELKLITENQPINVMDESQTIKILEQVNKDGKIDKIRLKYF